MKPLRIAAVAAEELREAHDWYEGRVPGLGRRFVGAVDQVLAGVAEAPRQHAVVHRDIRRAIVRPFPYAVFSRELPDVIRVVAVVHLHRDPSTWSRRQWSAPPGRSGKP